MSINNLNQDLLEIKMDDELKDGFSGLSQWLRYSALIGFLSALYSLINEVYGYMYPYRMLVRSSTTTMIISFIVLVLSVYVNVLLWRAARHLKQSMRSADQSEFTDGLVKLNQYFRVLGVASITALILISLFFILVFLSSSVLR